MALCLLHRTDKRKLLVTVLDAFSLSPSSSLPPNLSSLKLQLSTKHHA